MLNFCIILDMKRFNDGHSNAPFKRPKMGPDDIELRVLIPSKVVYTFFKYYFLYSKFYFYNLNFFYRLLVQLLVRVASTYPGYGQTWVFCLQFVTYNYG
jgi:hypothetical protein